MGKQSAGGARQEGAEAGAGMGLRRMVYRWGFTVFARPVIG